MHARKSSRELPTLQNELMKKNVTDINTHYDPKHWAPHYAHKKWMIKG